MAHTILYVINSLGPGGAERQLVYLIEHLDRDKYMPVVLTLDREGDTPDHFRAEMDALNVRVESLHLSKDARPIPNFINSVQRYVRFMWRLRPDLVQGCLHKANLITRAGRYLCPPHRLVSFSQEGYRDNQLRNDSRTAFLCDALIANSKRTQSRLIQDGGLKPSRVGLINCGVKVNHFAQNTTPTLRDELFPDATFVLLMNARITEIKDHPTVLKALHLIRDDLPQGFRLVLLGGVASAEAQDLLDTLIEQYDLATFVRQLPATDNVPPYYHAADATILASKRESFGLVVIESFAAKKPVIISEGANSLEVVEEDVTGWVFPTGDSNALAGILGRMLDMPSERLQQMGENAARIAPQFSDDLMASQWMALYDRLLNTAS